MQVTILGSGTSAGVPVLGCNCSVCKSPEPSYKRTRASVFLSLDNGKSILIDTPPELRLQMLRAGHSYADAVLYTHMHADHTHGFDDLRAFYFQKQEPVPAFLLKLYHQEMKNRFAYAFQETGYIGTKPQIDLRVVPKNGSFEAAGVTVESVVLPHGNVVSCGFRVGNFLYATDFKSFPEKTIEAWRGKIKVMVASGIHFKSHPTHSVIPETVALFEKLGVERGYITHLSHEVDALRDRAKLPSHIEFASDSMVIDLED